MIEPSSRKASVLIFIFWLAAFAGAYGLARSFSLAPGWDVRVYTAAMHSLSLGHDPYADGILVQQAHLAETRAHPYDMPPFTYVYSPITLPLLRLLMRVPSRWLAAGYILLFVASVVITAYVGLFAAEAGERKVFRFLTPATVFFPCMLELEVFLSGNLAYLLYGAILGAAVLGWRRRTWLPFYAAVLIATCFKAPFLSLLAIPPLSSSREWKAAAVTAFLGLILFFGQLFAAPSLFHHYLLAVQLQFDYNHDFGLSPAGLLGNLLASFNLPFSAAATAAYLVYGAAVAAVLIVLARRFSRGAFSLQQWIPVMVPGVILLNPRIKEYDVAPLTIVLALGTLRLFQRGVSTKRAYLEAFLFFLAVNGAAANQNFSWKLIAGTLLSGLFAAGAWRLWHLPSGAWNGVPPSTPHPGIEGVAA